MSNELSTEQLEILGQNEDWAIWEPDMLTKKMRRVPEGWYGVANSLGLVAFFQNEEEAFDYRARKILEHGSYGRVLGAAPTAPMAICLAALKAQEV